MTDKKPGLESAYALKTPEDSRKLYADWAETYDTSFARQMAYRLPAIVAERLSQRVSRGAEVLDVGAGTGLVAEALPEEHGLALDGLDISPDMLELARRKGLYRRTILGDLTSRLDLPDDGYDAIVSAGTFTHGHVGPEAFGELLRIARSGAFFILSVNDAHFAARGFDEALRQMQGRIGELGLEAVDIYGPGADPDHAGDRAQIVTFRKR